MVKFFATKKINLFLKFLLIRFIDKFVPKFGGINKNGFSIYRKILFQQNIDQEANDCFQLILNNPNLNNLRNNQVAGRVRNFNDILKIYPNFAKAITPEIIAEIKKYFGRNIKLDHVYLGIFCTSNSIDKQNNSGFFHHDSVGHRCKLFFPINPTGTEFSPTIYVNESNKKLWDFKLMNLNHINKRLEDFVKDNFQNKQSLIKANFGDVYSFDTNGLHKGSYNQSNELRCIIQFEFSRFKSLLRGDVGPGTFYMGQEAYTYLDQFNLIRNNRITKVGNMYIHKGLPLRDRFYKLENYLK